MKAKTIDEYLAALSEDKRAALEKLRKTVKAAASHCAFYPMSSSTVAAHRDDLKGYDTSKGTIRFPPDHPLPAALVRKLVKARIAENTNR